MTASVMLFFSTMITGLFFIVGVTIGWTANDFLYNMLSRDDQLHPEMYDEDGIVINEELLSVRFVDEEEEDYYND
tara:strand:+ start:483 stop:707 length:225 start_codon:yes stop_codon:yes gene_type:complete